MMTTLEFTLRLALAFGLGVLIGIERQWRQKSAGLRTNTLVCVGSAAFVLLSVLLTGSAGDPSRIAGQIVTGIGFLGAGVIMKDGLSIQGLNTAATIWCSAAVGSLAGVGFFAEAVITAIVVVAVHVILRPFGNRLNRIPVKPAQDEGAYIYALKIRCKEQVENHLRVLLINYLKNDQHLQLRALKSSDNGNPTYTYIEAQIQAIGKHDSFIEEIAGKFTLEYGVTEVRWEIVGQQND
ncbi:MAG: MgtC/SapB family protein [Cytophagales bacterium]|nr:MgtC/SapB family protein [Bernardetiaceae bacterium]MDW8209571.1 MgtC/SapB family protein [Cytophagales bacterium]